ncbi:unnamed protein product [Pleuronectes platessa]|uniref:PH domain-containing protein n=1 Tax=Pleuronectes platessa TaxID=8262 RepID=A0A9N7U4X9_PLEPL|nr:unnamed protein product [Pleuronectes platessa]
MSLPAKVMRDGQLEKRSSGLLQLWKKKRCVLTEDGLRLHSCRGSKAKELHFERMVTVDCVEYKRGLVYFTVVMATGKEIDFRCPQDGTAWNAEIALALHRGGRGALSLPVLLGVDQAERRWVEDSRSIGMILWRTA